MLKQKNVRRQSNGMRIQETKKGDVVFEFQRSFVSSHLVFEPLTELIEALTRAGIVKHLDMNTRAPIEALFPGAVLAFVFASRRHQPGAGGALDLAFFSAQLAPHATIVALDQETVMPAIRACCRAFSCALRTATNIGVGRKHSG
ncbi:hypothetical protein RHM66_11020 [Pseudomonas sp. RTB3]|nr:hypothetical protein RHM66_11020 [Pseudomonas sp. RTB3]